MKHGLFATLLAAFAMSCADSGQLAGPDDLTPPPLQSQGAVADDPAEGGLPEDPNPATQPNSPLVQPEAPATISDPGSPQGKPSKKSTTVTFRIRGAEIDGYLAALFTPSDLRLLIDGKEVPFTIHAPQMDLSQQGHAWKFATFELPNKAKNVQILLAINPELSHFTTNKEDGNIEAPGLPIVFDAPAHLIKSREKVVLELDLKRSLVASAKNVRELLPFFRIDY